MTHVPARFRGFALVEIAIALIIIGLLLGSGLSLVSSQLQQQKIKDTQKAMGDIQDALIGYAASQVPPHLPCPDKTSAAGAGTANDGLEDVNPATGVCVVQEGNIPWATLNVANADSWGHRFHYRVTPAFSNRAPAATPTHLTLGTIQVCEKIGCGAGTVLAQNVPAVVLSFGPNGRGGVTTVGTLVPAPVGADELENTNQNDTFISHGPATAQAPAGEFDDILVWLSPAVLISRLGQTGNPLP